MMTEQTTDSLDAAQRKLAKLARENAQLRKEANRLREKLEPGRHGRILNRAEDDAKLILHYRYSGMDVSRRWLDALGVISEWRYGWALGLLRAARLENVEIDSLKKLNICIRRLEGTAERYRKMADPRLTELRARAGRRYMLHRYR